LHRAASRPVLALLGLTLVFGNMLGLPAASASTTVGQTAVVSTTVNLLVEPGGELETFTPATFRAVVEPANAAGVVTFYADGVAVASANVVGGQAVIESNSRSAGQVTLTAAFSPSTGAAFAPATSARVPLKVNGVATVVVFDQSGRAVTEGSQVRVGQPIRLTVRDFPAKSLVTFMVGNDTLNAALVTDGTGGGSVVVVLAKQLPSSVYVLAAAGGKRSASFVFYVFNPSASPAASTGGSSAEVATPIPPSAGGDGGGSTAGSGQISSTGANGDNLAHTGADSIDLLLAALAAVGIGGGLLFAGRRPRLVGKHVFG